MNVLTVPLYAGAICEIMPKFNAKLVWERFIKGDSLNLYMAVPTIYGSYFIFAKLLILKPKSFQMSREFN